MKDSSAIISFLLTNDSEMKKINKRLLNNQSATDVISYAIDDEIASRGRYLGEVVVNQQAVLKNAKKYKVTYAQELARVVAHGVLHILGYEDNTPKGKEAMKVIEDVVVKEVN